MTLGLEMKLWLDPQPDNGGGVGLGKRLVNLGLHLTFDWVRSSVTTL